MCFGTVRPHLIATGPLGQSGSPWALWCFINTAGGPCLSPKPKIPKCSFPVPFPLPDTKFLDELSVHYSSVSSLVTEGSYLCSVCGSSLPPSLGLARLLIAQLRTTPGSKFCCSEAALISYMSSSRKNFEPHDLSPKLVGSQLREGRYFRGTFVP